MEPHQLFWIATAAVGGGMAGAAACRWLMSRSIHQLQERLERSEQARNGAIERSASARAQIAQLSQAILDLRRTHQTRPGDSATGAAATTTADERRAAAEKALAEAGGRSAVREGAVAASALQPFADTEIMNS